ncbi:hypothetical protein HDV00_001783, partial [Rhizophlyctis rosea]
IRRNKELMHPHRRRPLAQVDVCPHVSQSLRQIKHTRSICCRQRFVLHDQTSQNRNDCIGPYHHALPRPRPSRPARQPCRPQ